MTTQVNGNGAAQQAAPALAAVPEAPASVTARVLSPAGVEYLLTIRSYCTAAQVTALLQSVGNAEKWLIDHGWTPAPTRATSAPTTQAGQGNGLAAEAVAICDKCGQPMTRKQRRDGSGYFWSCNTKYGNGQWCRGNPVKQ